jgi:hypothetical protein
MATSGAVIARIVSQYSDKGTKAAQKDIARMGKQIDNWSRRVVKSYAVAGAAAAVFAYKIGKDAVTAAADDAKSANMLANSLRNVTGATTEQIAAVEDYISKQQKLVNVSDTELRSSLNTLVTATGDVTTAQYLQTRALDIAAGSGKDLSAVTMAMAKASQGNFTALGKMFPQLDKATLKSGNFSKMLGQLEGDYKGAAEAVAKQDPFTALKLQFGEVSEQLGYVLLPVVQEFASYLITDVIPNIEEWIALNKGKLQDSFKGILDTLVSLTVNLLKLVAVFEKYKWLILAIGAIPVINILGTQAMMLAGIIKIVTRALGVIKLAPIIGAFRGLGAAVSLVAGAFRAGGIAAALRGAISLFMQLNPYIRGATILIAGLVIGWNLLKKAFGGSDDAAKKTKLTNDQIAKQQKEAILAGYEQIAIQTEKAKNDKIAADRIAANTALQKKAADAQKKQAKYEADYKKINDRIAKNYGVKLLSSEDEKMVQINAAEALLKRQTALDIVNKELLKSLREEVLLMKVKNDYAMRYDDILKSLADNKITTQEIQILALKWGVTKEAVEAYLLQLKIIEDKQISDSEVIDLAKAWGSTQAQAAQYLDFFQALNDGFLDPSEIDKLKTKWNMTEMQVRQYADFVGVVNDGKLEDSEIKKLMDKWKLTTDEVVAYIKKIGSPVSYSGSLIDPATAATIGWKNAKDALEAYLALLGKGTTTTTQVPTTTNPTLPQGSTGNVGNIDAVNKQVADAAQQLVKEITATGESSVSISKVANDMAASLLADKDATAALGGVSGVLSSARYTGQALQYAAQEAAKAKLADSEITRDALRQLTSGGTLSDDQRLRLGMSSTVSTAASIGTGSSSGTTNVTVNVQGSVTSQNDLVSAIRQGLLQDQVSGKTLTVTAL